jgi:hypothetical protein
VEVLTSGLTGANDPLAEAQIQRNIRISEAQERGIRSSGISGTSGSSGVQDQVEHQDSSGSAGASGTSGQRAQEQVEHQYSSAGNIRTEAGSSGTSGFSMQEQANIDLVEVQDQAEHQGQGNIRVKEVQEHQDSVEWIICLGGSRNIWVNSSGRREHQDLAEVQDHQI